MIKVSQTLYSGRREDEKCFMYPVLDYNSFADCDEDYVYNELNIKCDLIPIWTARDNENVKVCLGMLWDLLDGTTESNCRLHCLSSQVHCLITDNSHFTKICRYLDQSCK